uniref:F-box and regulator of chromosome condensation repeat protein n=1 Tax=Pithovirus LCPAC202 TaxID=2506592 RepID=A0A481Z6H2_9VIRU|nr:MAG: F-box and regulator of chromosome condensation repeat protein [Pithovirus LCPAC202]
MNPPTPVPYSIFPTEISIEILLEIDNLDDLAKMCQSSKQVQEICRSDYFWERKYKQDYGITTDNNQSWKTRYKEKYSKYKELITPISCKHGTIGRIAEGKLYMWGKGNRGQLGNGVKNNSTIPIHIPFKKRIVSISCGKDFTGAITQNGLLYMWGKNDSYQLGIGKITRSITSPINIKIDGLVRKISCGDHCAASMTSDNAGYIWGLIGVLGEKIFEVGRYKRPTILLSHVIDISAGFETVFFVNSGFQIYQISPNTGISTLRGNLSDHTSSFWIKTNKSIKFIYASHVILVAVTTYGLVYHMSIDIESRLYIFKIILIQKLPPISKISSEWGGHGTENKIIAITKDRKIFALGRNKGIPSLPHRIDTPTEIEIGYRPVHVSVSKGLTCIITDDGYLNVWRDSAVPYRSEKY